MENERDLVGETQGERERGEMKGERENVLGKSYRLSTAIGKSRSRLTTGAKARGTVQPMHVNSVQVYSSSSDLYIYIYIYIYTYM